MLIFYAARVKERWQKPIRLCGAALSLAKSAILTNTMPMPSPPGCARPILLAIWTPFFDRLCRQNTARGLRSKGGFRVSCNRGQTVSYPASYHEAAGRYPSRNSAPTRLVVTLLILSFRCTMAPVKALYLILTSWPQVMARAY